MSYFNTKKEFSLRDLLYRALIFIGTVGIIVYFLPRDGKFNYQFDIDKPWKVKYRCAEYLEVRTAHGHLRLPHL